MDHLVLSVDQVRRVDQIAIRDYQMSGLVLMENAGANVARSIHANHSGDRSTSIIAGVGNNGGDGLVIARHLEYYGWKVSVWMVGDEQKLSNDCLCNLQILRHAKWDIQWISSSQNIDRQSLIEKWNANDLILDAMLGTGANGEPRSPMKELIELANDCQSIRLAIDQPTGINAQTGEVPGICFKAAKTFTFVAKKPGLIAPQNRRFVGEIEVIPIGIPMDLLRQYFLDDPLRLNSC